MVQQERVETLRLSNSITITVLYEDRYLLAVDKPAGLLVAPAHWEQTSRNLMLMLREGVERGVPWARRRNLRFIANVHRLDADTSGVLLLAKNRPALIQMTRRFEQRRVEKSYLALVTGVPASEQFNIAEPIGMHATIKGLMVIDGKQGRESLTECRVLERLGAYTLIEAKPVTGRTHQIRVHLAWAGLPVVADPLYGKQSNLSAQAALSEPMARLALHAQALSFKHPLLQTEVHIEAPLTKDFYQALANLRKTRKICEN
ncbi:MAG: RluA family pseudouridine synthase [Acidobacteriota bacterium]